MSLVQVMLVVDVVQGNSQTMGALLPESTPLAKYAVAAITCTDTALPPHVGLVAGKFRPLLRFRYKHSCCPLYFLLPDFCFEATASYRTQLDSKLSWAKASTADRWAGRAPTPLTAHWRMPWSRFGIFRKLGYLILGSLQ